MLARSLGPMGYAMAPRVVRPCLPRPLERLDQRLSQPVFRLKLPAYAEVLLSVPGAFMGTLTSVPWTSDQHKGSQKGVNV